MLSVTYLTPTIVWTGSSGQSHHVSVKGKEGNATMHEKSSTKQQER